MIEQINKEKIQTFIEEQEKTTSIWQLNENLEELWLDVKIWEWLKNDQKMLTYAEHFLWLKESWDLFWWIKLQFLELRLSITCPYFEDFKSFLKELKIWDDTEELDDNQDHTSDNIDIVSHNTEFMWTKVSEIKSQPFYKNPGSWVTRCAATARFNALDFGLDLPWWNAYDAWKNPWSNIQKTLPASKQNKKPSSSWSSLDINSFPKSDGEINFVDLYTSSSSKYGHRVVWFKDGTWQWYVLDPYTRVNWKLDNKPKKIEAYVKSKKIVKGHFYKSSWYRFESKKYA